MVDSADPSYRTYVYGDPPANGHDPSTTRPLTFQTASLSPSPRMKLDIPRRIGDFFIILTSADRTKIGSSSERHRYITIGLLMLVTAVQALYSATLFMSIGLGERFIRVIWFGVFFAVAVYLIDRSIIGFAAPVKLDKDGNLSSPRKMSGILIIRLLVAIAAAALMSEMILLQVFGKDIQQQIQQNHIAQIQQTTSNIQATYQKRISALQQQINKAQDTVNARQNTVNYWYKQVNCQEFGCPGIPPGEQTGFHNAENNLQNAQNALQNAQSQLQTIHNTDDPKIASIVNQEQNAVNTATPVISNADVVLSREEAFWQLTTKYGTVLVVRLFLTVLILGIDLAPVLSKITGRPTMHDVTDQSGYYIDLKKDRVHVRTDTYRFEKHVGLDQKRYDIEVDTALFQAQKRADVERAQAAADADVELYKIDFDADMKKREHSAGYGPDRGKPPDDPGQDSPGGPGGGPPRDEKEAVFAFKAKPPLADDPPPDKQRFDGNKPDERQPRVTRPETPVRYNPFGGARQGNYGSPGTPALSALDEFAELLFHRDRTGRRIDVLGGRWELQGRLRQADKGGGGYVLQATDRRGEPGWFVVKTVPIGSVSMETTARLQKMSIENERHTQGIVSPNIGRIVDYGEDQGLSYIVYPLYQPGSLARYCRQARHPLTLHWSVELICQVLAGLIDASSESLVHLDIKPGNIVLDGARARIIDWGLSRSWNTNQPYTAVARGSAFFACPEQLMRQSRGWDTPLADLYSVGATFYWLLAGEAPLRYDAGNRSDLLTYRNLLASGARPQPVHELVPGVPRQLSMLIDRWLSLHPRARVPSGTRLDQAPHRAYDELYAMLPLLPEMPVGRVTGRRRKRRRRGVARMVALTRPRLRRSTS